VSDELSSGFCRQALHRLLKANETLALNQRLELKTDNPLHTHVAHKTSLWDRQI
jgi:hypothetical protein